MAVPLEKFVKQLEDSGIIAGDTLKDFLPPKSEPKDAEELALELIGKKKLTKFQAEEVSKGKGKSLTLGNYVLMEKIGAGGMGQVFKAEHRRMHRIVAVKVLPANTMKDPATVARFEREVTAAAKLRHPNIIAADDADQANDVHFLVMEYVDGSDLSALVKKNGPFPVEKAVNYILQAAKGLGFAHAEGVVHRDIKPANLLLDKKGMVKILDMGLARIHGDAGQAELTSTGAVMGTVDYMAPEQALNTKTADARADIYALGCSLYYLLTGKATYDGDTLMAKLLAHRDQPIPSLRSVRAEVPESLEVVFKKMVAKKIEDRYQTMTEVISALEGCGGGLSNTVTFHSSDAGQTIIVQDKSVSSRTTTLQPPTRESVVKSNGPRTDTNHTENLDDLPPAPTRSLHTKKLVKKGKPPLLKDQNKLLLIGGAVLGVLILLAGVSFSIKTKEGKLIVTVNEPDAEVQVLSEEGKIEITRKGEKSPITITVVPGKHRLKVQKDGFELFTDGFEIKSGNTESMTAKLLPLEKTLVKSQSDGLRFTDIFNGRDLMGWNVIGDQANWNVDASTGVLTAMGTGVGWLLTNQEYADFILKLEYQTVPGANSGVAILASPSDQDHLEVGITQISGYSTGGLWSNPTNHVNGGYIPASPQGNEKSADQWNSLEVELRTRKLRVAINGIEVSEFDLNQLAELPDSFPPLKRLKGRIGLQSQQNTVRFRNVRVAEIAAQSSSSERWNTPAFQQWVKEVQAMPAEKQVEAVRKRLMELNPGFDGKVTGWEQINVVYHDSPQIENGVVKEFGFAANDVTDISPLRALLGLKRLKCKGTSGKGKLSDLSPLNGMRLVSLDCSNTKVSDLTPVTGMPLTWLAFTETEVTDLSPVKGMPLRELWGGSSLISDLTPLNGLPLRWLACDRTRVADLTPLKGMEIEKIFLTIADIANGMDSLRQMKSLNGIGTSGGNELPPAEFWKKYDAGEFRKPLAFEMPGFDQWVKEVQAMPAEKQIEAVSKKLVEFNPGFDGRLTGTDSKTPFIENGFVTRLGFDTDHVTDISPVRAFTHLYALDCVGRGSEKGRLSDLSPLKGMGLGSLVVSQTNVSDLSVLKGMNLSFFSCDSTLVSDISPLKGMPLANVNFHQAKVADLSPLSGSGMSLKSLVFSETPVSDVSPLEGMKLIHLVFTPKNITKGMDVIRNMKTVESLGTRGWPEFTPEEFWKKYDAGEFGKSTPSKPLAFQTPAFREWAKDVQAMSAENQIEAVSKKLMELNPGFDGKLTNNFGEWFPVITNGSVTIMSITADNVTDVSPIRALVGLEFLGCWGSSPERGKLRDLSPLKEMKIKTLKCGNNPQLSDLSPLKGVPLIHLNCTGTQVTNLSALQGMALEELWIGNTQVSDLSPLKAMPLKDLLMWGTKVEDLSPLKGMELGQLNIAATPVADLSPLKGMPLGHLTFNHTPISDLSPLKGMPLTGLNVSATNVSDLSPLEGMKLDSLYFTPPTISKGVDVIRKMRSLKTLGNDKPIPAEEFWKKYDAGEFGKP